MKIPSLFTKSPNYKRFAYNPRHYEPQEEERKEREERIRRELSIESGQKKEDDDNSLGYRSRMVGSFRSAKKTATVQKDPSANMLRLIILLVLAVGLIAFIEYGKVALYGVALIIVPFYFYLKFRKFRR